MRKAGMSATAALVAVLLLSGVGLAQAQSAGVEQEIQARVAQLTSPGALSIEGAPIIADRLIKRIYEQRQFRPAWNSEANVAALLDAIDESESHGLDPEDFHRIPIMSFKDTVGGAGAAAQANFDVLLTDALLRLAYQQYFGKVDPVELDSVWNFQRPLIEDDLDILVIHL